MLMEPGLDCLNRARRELVACSEWAELNKQLRLLLNDIQGPLDISSVSMKEISKRVKETDVYRELQIKISSCLTRHFVPGMQESYPHYQKKMSTGRKSFLHLPESSPKAFILNDQTEANHCISIACAHLLHSNPRLKHFIKNCLNHPLGNNLRKTAWRMLLQSRSNTPTVKRVTRHNLEKLLSLTADRKMVGHKLDRILASTPTLSNIAKCHVAVETVKTVTLYWKQENGNLVLDRDLFLCIPFVSVWSEALEHGVSQQQLADGHGGRGAREEVIVEVAKVYTSFMKILPLTMSGMETEAGEKAMSVFCLQVEELLKLNDPKLYRCFAKMLNSQSSMKTSPKRKHHSQCFAFHEELARILHPHVQRMLVGVLPLDVVCYIWDQCFIGRTVPYFQCLHYYIAAWLILLRDKLLTCPTVKSISDVLKNKSAYLGIQQFQREIEKTFLRHLSAELGVTPILLPGSFVRDRAPKSLFSGRSSSSRPHSFPAPPTQTVFDQRPRTDRLVKAAVSNEHRLDREKEHLQQEIEILRRKLEEQHKILSDKTEKERLLRKREVETLQHEIDLLRKRVTCRTSTPWPPSLTITPQSARRNAWIQCSSTSILSPSLSVLTSAETMSSTLRNYTENRSTDTESTRQSFQTTTRPLTFSGHGTDAVSEHFSSNSTYTSQLSLEEAQEIWLKIFARFSNGLYLLCHGEGKEKEALLNALANRVASNSKDELH